MEEKIAVDDEPSSRDLKDEKFVVDSSSSTTSSDDEGLYQPVVEIVPRKLVDFSLDINTSQEMTTAVLLEDIDKALAITLPDGLAERC